MRCRWGATAPRSGAERRRQDGRATFPSPEGRREWRRVLRREKGEGARRGAERRRQDGRATFPSPAGRREWRRVLREKGEGARRGAVSTGRQGVGVVNPWSRRVIPAGRPGSEAKRRGLPATSLGDGDTSRGLLHMSLISMDATLSPRPERPRRMDERQRMFATSLVPTATSLLLRDKRRVEEAASPSRKPRRLSSKGERRGSFAETPSFFAERRGSNAETLCSMPETLCSIPGAACSIAEAPCFIPTTRELLAETHRPVPTTLRPIAPQVPREGARLGVLDRQPRRPGGHRRRYPGNIFM